jgi:hypothetical protein
VWDRLREQVEEEFANLGEKQAQRLWIALERYALRRQNSEQWARMTEWEKKQHTIRERTLRRLRAGFRLPVACKQCGAKLYERKGTKYDGMGRRKFCSTPCRRKFHNSRAPSRAGWRKKKISASKPKKDP